MATINIYSKDGTAAKTLEFDAVEFNEALVHQALVAEHANRREGTAETKTRADVRGGGRKPWKQKGTGRARAGSTRSPLWVGGGVIFGPHARSYSKDLPKQMRKAAVRSALFSNPEKFRLVTDYSFAQSAKTSDVAQFLKSLGCCGSNVLILVDHAAAPEMFQGARNLPNVQLRHPQCPSVDALLWADVILATEADFDALKTKYAATAAAVA